MNKFLISLNRGQAVTSPAVNEAQNQNQRGMFERDFSVLRDTMSPKVTQRNMPAASTGASVIIRRWHWHIAHGTWHTFHRCAWKIAWIGYP